MQHTEASIFSLKRHHHVVHFVHRKDMPHGVRLESDGIGDAEGDTVGKPFSHTEKDEDNLDEGYRSLMRQSFHTLLVKYLMK